MVKRFENQPSKGRDIFIKFIIVGAAFLVLLLTLFGLAAQYEVPDKPAGKSPGNNALRDGDS